MTAPRKQPSAADKAILGFDPWGGGKGDDPHLVLRNAMVVARYQHKCAICFGPIAKGERYRAQTEANLDGSRQVKTFRFCVECCEAMSSWLWDSDAICDRYSLGEKRARERRA